MATHIHIHTKTKDAGPAHAPAGSSNGGQFVATTGGGGGKKPNSSGVEVKRQPSGTTVPHQAPKSPPMK